MDTAMRPDGADQQDAASEVIVVGGGQAGLAMAWHLNLSSRV
jgi:cation diffusion facilitator CzcD-associated flavoprotein CzcO